MRSGLSTLTLLFAVTACGGASKPEAPAPPEPPPRTTGAHDREPLTISGIATCDEYAAFVASYSACERVPAIVREAALYGAHVLLERAAPTSGDERARWSETCRQARDGFRANADLLGCSVCVPEGDYDTIIAAHDHYERSPDADPSMAHCTELLTVLERYVLCENVPEDLRRPYHHDLDLTTYELDHRREFVEDARLRMDDTCLMETAVLRATGDAVGCDL